MAFFADNIGVRAIQFEGRKVVVKGGGFPTGSLVTCATVRPVFTLMFVILLVTGKTSRGGAFENLVEMAIAAFRRGVFTIQFESCQIMVKGGWSPARGLMADGAVLPKFTLMRIVFQVTGVAVTGGGFEIGGGLHCQMAFGAIQPGVLTIQLKGRQVVIKGLSNAFDAIVTIPASSPVSQGMSRHVAFIHLCVAGAADGRVEAGDVFAMTVIAAKNLSVAAAFVRVKRIPRAVVRKTARLHIRQSGVGAAMVDMAGAAGNILILDHHAMHGSQISQLGGNFSVTDQAALVHGDAFPGSRVAFGASSANLSV